MEGGYSGGTSLSLWKGEGVEATGVAPVRDAGRKIWPEHYATPIYFGIGLPPGLADPESFGAHLNAMERRRKAKSAFFLERGGWL